jgi:hypothetical protein
MERGTLPHFTVNGDISAVILDNSLCQRQPQSVFPAFFIGGEKRIENLPPGFFHPYLTRMEIQPYIPGAI